MTRPHPCVETFYALDEFKILEGSDDFSYESLEWNSESNIALIINEIPIYNTMSNDKIENLLKYTNASLVGVGSETIHDEKIRSSNEITSEHISLNPVFENLIKTMVTTMAKELNHPTNVIPKLYKLIIYKEGDFFKEHIDSVHEDNMIMTLSVQLDTNSLGGELCINGEPLDRPESNHISLILFYNDIKHQIGEVTKGYQISLIFNIVQDQDQSPIIDDNYKTLFKQGISKLKDKGINKIGFIANHLYMGDEIKGHMLKNTDKIGYELLKLYSKEIKFINVCVEADSNLINCFHEDLMPIMSLSQAFGSLYFEHSGKDDEEAEDDEEKEEVSYSSYNNTSYDHIKINYDVDNKYHVIKDEYLLGDVIFLKSKPLDKKIYKGDDEVYLGNGGFVGNIYENLAIVFYLN